MSASTVFKTQDAESQAAITPQGAIDLLREGNRRFVAGERIDRPLDGQLAETAGGQFPFAVVLGCIDSRVPIETAFDQGIGDVFAARVAGNVVNADVLGSMEFACKLAGSKAVVVLGHTSCGAVKGSIAKAELGNLTGLVRKIDPAVDEVAARMSPDHPSFTDQVAEVNVMHTLDAIRMQSPILRQMEEDGAIAIVGAMYDVASGEAHFL
jgi:carbonic anhydrase